MLDFGPGSNYNDGSDRLVIRAVAYACGWQLMRITDDADYFVWTEGAEREDHGNRIAIEVGYETEPGDVYRRKLREAALRSDIGTHSVWTELDQTIFMLRTHQRAAWQRRLENARREA